MHSSPCAHCSRRKQRSPKSPCPSRVGFRFWASPFPSRLANASGRIVFNMVLFMDWQFVSGCSPPRLSTTQFPSTTDSQCSVRWGLSPHGWRALSGALGRSVPDRRCRHRASCFLLSAITVRISSAYSALRSKSSSCGPTSVISPLPKNRLKSVSKISGS